MVHENIKGVQLLNKDDEKPTTLKKRFETPFTGIMSVCIKLSIEIAKLLMSYLYCTRLYIFFTPSLVWDNVHWFLLRTVSKEIQYNIGCIVTMIILTFFSGQSGREKGRLTLKQWKKRKDIIILKTISSG